jgi:hypothetical protein
MAKLQVRKRVRKVRDGVKGFGKRHIKRIPMPPYHHALLSLSLISALFAMICFSRSPKLALIFLILMLALDLLDFAITEKYFLHSNSRHIRDQMADRLSEAILFIQFFNPWFFLFTVNCVLTIAGYIKRRNISMPLKVLFVIYFVIVHII